MRLIDADAVYKILESCEIRKATIGNPLTDWEYGYTCGIERAEDEIECATTVDAVPVIRCKDCKHYYADPWGYGNCVFEGGVSRRTKTSDFCSWGERRKNGKTD